MRFLGDAFFLHTIEIYAHEQNYNLFYMHINSIPRVDSKYLGTTITAFKPGTKESFDSQQDARHNALDAIDSRDS